jgi:benzoate membrane transport protein
MEGARPDPPAGTGGYIQPISAGLLAAIVGFASTFAVVLQALIAVGASQAQAASGLLALLVVKSVVAILLSVRWRMPISIAWSTPGTALLIATGLPEGGFPAAVGAFLVASGLVVAAGLWGPFGRAVASIPVPLASAMLAGVLLDLCLAPVRAVGALPALALPVVIAWALAWRFARPYAIPLAVLVTAIMVVFATPLPAGALADLWPRPIFVAPRFELSALVSISVPLFIVTMASQNIPGLAVLNLNGYRPAVGPIFVATGAASAIISLFGGHLVNLAAITAALCAGPDAHPDPSRRWVAAVTAGASYVALGMTATLRPPLSPPRRRSSSRPSQGSRFSAASGRQSSQRSPARTSACLRL